MATKIGIGELKRAYRTSVWSNITTAICGGRGKGDEETGILHVGTYADDKVAMEKI